MPKLIGIWPTSWGLGAQRWWTSRESWFYVFESRSWNGWTWKIQQILTHMATRQVAPWPRVLREGNGRWCSRWKLNAHRSLQLWLIWLPEWIIFCSKKTDMGSVKRSTRGWYIDTWHIHFSDIRTWPVSVDWKILISDSIKSYQVRTLGRKHVATAPLGIGMDFWDQSRPHRNGHWFAAFNG